jgi:hypothetical protein
MKNKITLIFLLPILLLLFCIAKPVEAHFLATDKNIGAVLHVDPNDEPIAGSQASFFFEFKDKENKFNPQNCDCTFFISENEKVIFSQALFQNNSSPNLTNASVFYTFPQIDVYEVKVVGKPLTPNAFQPFTLTWNFRVDQQANANEQTISEQNSSNFFSTHLIHFWTIGIFIIFFLIYFLTKIIKSKKTSMEGGEKKDEEKDSGNIY